MKKYHFTTKGMQRLQLELFNLNDIDLAEKAAMIQTNFVQFLEENFTLSDSQKNFIKQIDERFLIEAGRECEHFLKKRQLIGFYNNKIIHHISKPICNNVLDMKKQSLQSFSLSSGYQVSETLNFIVNESERTAD